MFENKVVLFWNTKNSIGHSDEIQEFNYEDELPKEFHKYFDCTVEITT